MARRHLIVNADDFGQGFGINRGIVRAHEEGIVTSTSLMVRWPAAEAAADYGRQRASLGVGLHVDLGEWALRSEEWVPVYQVVDVSDAAAVQGEVERQWSRFCDLMGKPPTHLDSHQHVHLREPVRSIVQALASRHGIALRQVTPGIRYCGEFYGQTTEGVPLPDRIGVEALVSIIASLPGGVTELACHPAEAEQLETTYLAERTIELESLCDPRVATELEKRGIGLVNFASMPGGRRTRGAP